MAESQLQTEAPGLRVSVVMAVYNQAEALRRALAALEKSQDRERLEIVVVDCGSRDESARMDEEFPSINLLRLPHHLGATRAMNIGTRTAKAEAVFYLSPDVEVEPSTVTKLADILEPESNLAAVCPLLVDPGGNPVSRLRALPSKESVMAAARGSELPWKQPDLAQEFLTVDYPSLDALMIRKVFVRGMNYFDQRFGHYWADADLAMQLRRASKTVRLYPSIRATLHPGEDPMAGDSLARSDRISGAAAFVSKYGGFLAGFLFQLGAAFSSLARLDFGQFSAILSGRKLDGSQAA
jgi:GT2 family glycosyltransferase